MSNSFDPQKFIAPFLKRKITKEHIKELHSFFNSKGLLVFLEKQFSNLNHLGYSKKDISKLLRAVEFSLLGLAIHSLIEDSSQIKNKLNILIGDLLIIKSLHTINELEVNEIKNFFHTKAKSIFNSQLHLNLQINKNNLSIKNYFNNKFLNFWTTLPLEIFLEKNRDKIDNSTSEEMKSKLSHYALIKKELADKATYNFKNLSFLKLYLQEKSIKLDKEDYPEATASQPIKESVKAVLQQEKDKILNRINKINLKLQDKDFTLFLKAQKNYLLELEKLSFIN